MKSFIIDNGMESNMNRGSFVGYRNANGDLEGVALIGHSTLVEARRMTPCTQSRSWPDKAKRRSI
jgi:hypothetical protein